MSEPKLDDNIALGLDEICEECDNGTDQPCDECSTYQASTSGSDRCEIHHILWLVRRVVLTAYTRVWFNWITSSGRSRK